MTEVKITHSEWLFYISDANPWMPVFGFQKIKSRLTRERTFFQSLVSDWSKVSINSVSKTPEPRVSKIVTGLPYG